MNASKFILILFASSIISNFVVAKEEAKEIEDECPIEIVEETLPKEIDKATQSITHKNKKICEELSFLAVQSGDVDALKLLTNDNDFSANFIDNLGMSLLHYSVKYNFLSGVSILLMYGANINAINDLSMTPLHYAVKNGNIEIARILLSHGAEVKIGNKLGLTPILFLFFSNECELDKMLCDPGKMLDLLMSYESEYGHQEYLKLKELFGNNPACSRFFD